MEEYSPPFLRVIVGPTAAGKSTIAMKLAARTGAELISADSRQVYRGFDIGTAKPSIADRSLVKHQGIDVADPAERYSAARWAHDARGWISDATRRGAPVIVVGGTGFYIRSLVEPLFVAPRLNEARRARLEELVSGWPLDELRRWVVALDPARAHLGPAQLRRALETALLYGRRISDLHTTATPIAPWPARYLVVDPGRTVLNSRIEQRVDAMLDAGWLYEARALALTVAADAPAWNSTGYESLRRLAEGSHTRAEAREAVIIATRQYAKRQRTWIRHQLPLVSVTRVDPLSPYIEAQVAEWWSGELVQSSAADELPQHNPEHFT